MSYCLFTHFCNIIGHCQFAIGIKFGVGNVQSSMRAVGVTTATDMVVEANISFGKRCASHILNEGSNIVLIGLETPGSKDVLIDVRFTMLIFGRSPFILQAMFPIIGIEWLQGVFRRGQ
jgi:hypothetical protein